MDVHLLGVWDYVVISTVLLISSGIGIYCRFTGGKQSTVGEYLFADSNMHVVPVAFSLMASTVSAISLLGNASEIYTFGLQFIILFFGYVIVAPIASYVYLPIFFQLRVTSVYEYLGKRYGTIARLIGSLAYSLQMIFYSGLVLYAPALALEAVTGLSKNVAILSIGLVCTFYSSIGGMKAVIITDVFQSLLMFGALASIPIFAIRQSGSLAEIWRVAKEGNRTDLLNFEIDPTVRHSWFSLIIGGGITFLSQNCVSQTQVQRYLTVKDLKRARQALWLQFPIIVGLNLCTSLSGLAIYARYYDCDPVSNGSITSSDQLMPYYVVDSTGHIPGLSGLFVAGIFSGSLSSLSSSLNCLAAVTLEDYLKPVYHKLTGSHPTDSQLSFYSKAISFGGGIICIGFAFLAQLLGGVLQAALTVIGILGGPLLGIFTLGMCTINANQKGAIMGFFSGLTVCLWAAFGRPRPGLPKLPVRVDACHQITAQHNVLQNESREYFWLYRLSYLYNGFIGFICTLVVGFMVSWISNKFTGLALENTDPDLFVPCVARRIKERVKCNQINMRSL
ncbi:hypothetical protein PPYR_09650 [Photinus pyralis]|uniref:Sodium-dependent multivitamin transporter n=1 Tax=Photinus pyralis TaxID=7054 RepID=A0A5N4AMW6_PHOPY|nr:putative sodium-dependent multivitamin transporter [Photinus pyralis]XP_031343167.1 putative sodium-dependent multivitamin transporter [Photinus pyralis]KAB0798657.1 hypothetical protein PPYR_09650 [Photinus pyralis]